MLIALLITLCTCHHYIILYWMLSATISLCSMFYVPGDVKVVLNEGMPQHKNPFDKGRLIINFSVSWVWWCASHLRVYLLKEVHELWACMTVWNLGSWYHSCCLATCNGHHPIHSWMHKGQTHKVLEPADWMVYVCLLVKLHVRDIKSLPTGSPVAGVFCSSWCRPAFVVYAPTNGATSCFLR